MFLLFQNTFKFGASDMFENGRDSCMLHYLFFNNIF